MLKLIVEPLIRLSVEETNSKRPDPELKKHPRLIVIDGLDECLDTNVQCDLLRIIADASIHLPYPLRFLITSRPESHIARVFEHDLIDIPRYNLSNDLDADKDIRIFLEQQFEEIRRTHRLGPYLPLHWPLESAIGSLVERSSSHFIYASTVIRFIRSPKHRPDDRLQVILGLQQPHEKDRPYALLDSLYSVIFLDVEDGIGQIHRALGIIHLRSSKAGLFGWSGWTRNCLVIEQLLKLRPGDLVLLFDPLLALVAFDQDDIRIYHKTLFDYLLDSDRSGNQALDLSLAHGAAVQYYLEPKIDLRYKTPDEFQNFVYHCQFAPLDDITIRYLQFLASNTIVNMGYSATQELQTNMYFLHVLSRPDFDSTGRWCRTFVENRIQNFSSRESWAGWFKSIRNGFWNSAKFTECVQTSFWPFHDFKLIGSLCDRVNGCYRRTVVPAIDRNVFRTIEREHGMFSSLLKIYHPEPEILFSVLQGSDGPLCHSCHFITDCLDHITGVMIVTYTIEGVRLSCSAVDKIRGIDLFEILSKVVKEHLKNTQEGLLGDCMKVVSTAFPTLQ